MTEHNDENILEILPETVIPTKKRLASMLLDHAIMCFVLTLFFIPNTISKISIVYTPKTQPGPDLYDRHLYLAMFGFSLYFCKDCILGRSPAKRILKFQVVSNSTGDVASPIQCLIRNITCILWPIEVLVTLFNSNRRIGDFLAGTKVVPFNPHITQPKPNFLLIGLSVIISYGLSIL